MMDFITPEYRLNFSENNKAIRQQMIDNAIDDIRLARLMEYTAFKKRLRLTITLRFLSARNAYRTAKRLIKSLTNN